MDKLSDMIARTKDGVLMDVTINLSEEVEIDSLELLQMKIDVATFFLSMYREEFDNSKHVDLINMFENKWKLPVLNLEVY